MKKDKVTWLIPVKNGMPFITETLRGIYNSTYDTHETLILDNGSTDGTLEEIKKWIPSRIKGRVIVDETCSLGAARARLVRESRSEYCVLIDADDIPNPSRIEEQLAIMRSAKDLAVLGSELTLINESGSEVGHVSTPHRYENILLLMLLQNAVAQPSVMFKKSLILGAGNYRDIPYAEDYDLWLRVLIKYRIANLKKPNTKYRIRSNSETRKALRAGLSNKITREIAALYSKELWGIEKNEFLNLEKYSALKKSSILIRSLIYIKKNHNNLNIFNAILSRDFLYFLKIYYRHN